MSAATQNEMERLRKELEAAQAERDALASRVDFLNQQNSALVAHVERLHNALGPKLLDWIDCGMATNNRHKEAWARELRNELHQALVETPTTSLDRLKAEWQAEAMEGWLEQMRYMEGLNTFDCMESAELYAEELRRQAEENSDE